MRDTVLALGLIALCGCAALQAVATDAGEAVSRAVADPTTWVWPWGTAAAGVGVVGYIFRGALGRLAVYLRSKISA